jgi:hypothetical protein
MLLLFIAVCFAYLQLCERAKASECPLWFTSQDQDTPLHADLPLNTAVALPIRLESSQKVLLVLSLYMQLYICTTLRYELLCYVYIVRTINNNKALACA